MTEFLPGEAVDLGMKSVPVSRILGRNPGPMTGPGTNSYLIGQEKLCLVDPGPLDPEQLANFLSAIGERKLVYILLTHTHGDHSPGAMPLAAETGAEIVGLPAPEGIAQDHSTRFSRQWVETEELDVGEYKVGLIHTPGHVSNHLCYLLIEEQLLFTGDHVLQGTTSVILPPDGDMADYLNSLQKLQSLELKGLAPGHGGIMEKPQEEIAGLIAHRLKREEKIVERLVQLGKASVDELVLSAYDDVAEHLIPWAKKTLLAHLIKLQKDGRAVETDSVWEILPA